MTSVSTHTLFKILIVLTATIISKMPFILFNSKRAVCVYTSRSLIERDTLPQIQLA
jgi:hypothetical protein